MKESNKPLSPNESLDQIQVLINSGLTGNHFAQVLRKRKIPHLSFSQVAAVEFCQRRYFLDYIQGIELDPMPNYFIKGKLMHEFIASSYNRIVANRKINPLAYESTANRYYGDHHRNHLINAIKIHLENLWKDYKIIGVERPFVMMVNKSYPPFVGVIDLLLEKDGQIFLVDHKTGNDFYPPDELQMAIYYRYAKTKFPRKKINIFYDRYRWVNNLDRIRKPAFSRSPVTLPVNYWRSALNRINKGVQLMNKIKLENWGRYGDLCYRCPFRVACWENS